LIIFGVVDPSASSRETLFFARH